MVRNLSSVLFVASLLLACTTSDAPPGTTVDPSAPWRSAYYPEGWQPGTIDDQGRGLHDFSYAGYSGGTLPIGDASVATIYDVARMGADTSGGSDATASVQAAIDEAASNGGGVVYFPAGSYRFDGELSVSSPNIVLRGDGPEASRLSFTTSGNNMSHVRFAGQLVQGAELSLATDAADRQNVVELSDASALSIGDDVALGWVISPAFIAEHGMTGIWQAFNDSWQPMFRRAVVDIDLSTSPHRVTLDVPLRYAAKLRDGASLRVTTGYLDGCGVDALGLANAVGWDEAWAVDQVHVLELDGVKDAWIRNVATFTSPMAPSGGPGAGAHLQSGGLLVRNAKRVTVADSVFAMAQNRGPDGNGYLVEVRSSSEVLVRDSEAHAGRHNFIQNWGFGTSGCVWLRVHSHDGRAWPDASGGGTLIGHSEFHHSLAMANLIDASTIDDGWSMVNRLSQSTGAGHTATESVLWNVSGTGQIRSRQYGNGYLIGTAASLDVRTETNSPDAIGTEPRDILEGAGRNDSLMPASLYEDQLAHRLATAR